MIPFSLYNIAPVLDAERIGTDCIIFSVTTNSRVVTYGSKCLFVALKGKTFDAHDFAVQAVDRGAIALLVDRPLPLYVSQLVVKDTRRALGQLSAWVRQQVSARVVALTGSSGKTSVKEMTAAILSQCGRVLATKENYNNEIGVALTLLRLTQQDDFLVIELGANELGEISLSTHLVQPETALVNNISEAHLTGFHSLSGVAQAKGEIFSGLPKNGLGILNSDSCDLAQWQQMLTHKKIWRFALHAVNGVDFFASNIISNKWETQFILHTPKGTYPVRVPLPGRHNIANALAASSLALSVGATLSEISSGLAKLRPLPGRMFPIELDKTGRLLIDDSYNANVASSIVAMQVLSEMPGYRVMVVGDILELGNNAIEHHQKIGKYIAIINIDKVLSIGPLSYFISTTSGRGEHFKDHTALISRLLQLLSEHTVITVLVKGSRNTHMERIVKKLKERVVC